MRRSLRALLCLLALVVCFVAPQLPFLAFACGAGFVVLYVLLLGDTD
jgi:hypothetical protein